MSWSWIHAEENTKSCSPPPPPHICSLNGPAKCHTSSLSCSVLLPLHEALFFSHIPRQDGFALNKREHFAAKQVQGFQDSNYNGTLSEGVLVQGTGCLMFSSIALVEGGPLLCMFELASHCRNLISWILLLNIFFNNPWGKRSFPLAA